MEMIQTRNKNELLREIGNLSAETRELYINARPSMDIVMTIFESAPNLELLACPPSLLKQTSTRVFKTLDNKGVVIKHHEVGVGRPKKYNKKSIGKIMEMRNNGVPVKEIAKQMNIPLRTVYYHLKNNK
ncbi:MAG: helix-turn-helix domain-containing protein [Candidatus Diapherotrites archaeon]|nr:helix-turn-helix domain-containing protein [Candidatus Diapherotrites archaeon]